MEDIYLKRTRSIPLLLITFFLHTGCTPDAEKRFKEGMELYQEKQSEEAGKKFEEGIIKFSSKKAVKDEKILTCHDAVYIQRDDHLNIIYPVDVGFNNTTGDEIVSVCPVTKKIAVSSATLIRVYNSEGTFLKEITPPNEEKKEIKAVSLLNNSLLYYLDKKLFRFNLETNTLKQFTNTKFHKPYKDPFYRVIINQDTDYTAIVIGIAGLYNLNIINNKTNTLITRDLRIATSKIYISIDNAYFITGKAGSWSLNKLSLATNIRTKLINLKGIQDIELTLEGLLYSSDSGLFLLKYDEKKPIPINFNYELIGDYSNLTLIKHLDTAHIVDISIFIEKYDFLRSNTPDLFPELLKK